MSDDLDLVRAILLSAAAAAPDEQPALRSMKGMGADTIMEHQARLIDDGMLVGKIVTDYSGNATYAAVTVTGMTQQGFTLAKNICDERVWQKTRTAALKRSAPISTEALADLAAKFGAGS